MADLAAQEGLPILIYNSATLARSLKVRNPCQQFAQGTWDTLRETGPWSMVEFEQARQKIYHKFPWVKNLWQALF